MFENLINACSRILPVSIAIFTMTFGAGNLIFPLSCGVAQGSFATFLGFLSSATLISLIGLYLTIDYKGSYRNFIAAWTGGAIADAISFFAMAMLGPLVCIPRCILVAKAALEYFTEYSFSIFVFGAVFILLIFSLLILKSGLVKLLGNTLGVLNICLMIIFIGAGVYQGGVKLTWFTSVIQDAKNFGFGFVSGYKTLDLLAGIFYAHSIYTSTEYFLLKFFNNSTGPTVKDLCKRAAVLSCLYFTAIYFGFFVVAANFSSLLCAGDPKSLIFQVSSILFGSLGSFFACAIVFLSCLCASIGLCVVFADYVCSINIIKSHVTYKQVLLSICLLSWTVSILGFERIDCVIGTVLQFVCPILIVICFLGLFKKIQNRAITS